MSKLTIKHVLILAAIVRVIVAGISYGTNDALLWREYAIMVDRVGLFRAYYEDAYLNHPPLSLLWAYLSLLFAGGSLYVFCIAEKIPGLLGDLLATRLLWRIAGENGMDDRHAVRIALLYALNPLAILISAYHGNTDSLMAALVLGAFRFARRDRPGYAGLLLAAAINVKLAPLPCVIILLASVRTWRGFAAALGGLAAGTVPFIPVLALAWEPFVKQALGYLPLSSAWGLMVPATLEYQTPTWIHVAAWMRGFHEGATRWVTLALAVALAWMTWRRRLDPVAAAAVFWCVLVAWTTAAVQYLAWPLPLMAALRPRLAVVYGLTGALYVGWRYAEYWVGSFPLLSYFTMFPNVVSRWVGLLPWVVLVYAAIVIARMRSVATKLPADRISAAETV